MTWKSQMSEMKPKDAIELKEVPLVNLENFPPKDRTVILLITTW